MARKKGHDEIPEEFNTYKAAAEFWDTHDSTNYLDHMGDVEIEVSLKKRPTRERGEPQFWLGNQCYALRSIEGNPTGFQVVGLALADLEDATNEAIRTPGSRTARLERPSGSAIVIDLAKLVKVGKGAEVSGPRSRRSLQLAASSFRRAAKDKPKGSVPVFAYNTRALVLRVLADAAGTVFFDLAEGNRERKI